MTQDIIKLVLQCIITLSAVIPLIMALIRYVNKYRSKSGWDKLVQLVMDLCVQAENNFEKGSDKKNWVISMVQKLSSSIDYDISNDDLKKIELLIDDIIETANDINR